MPLSASIARPRLAEAFPDDRTEENVHPNTYAAHPVACAAALANLKIMEQDRLVENAETMGGRLLDGLSLQLTFDRGLMTLPRAARLAETVLARYLSPGDPT